MLGASQQWDRLNDQTESSTTPSLRAGGRYRMGNSFNLKPMSTADGVILMRRIFCSG